MNKPAQWLKKKKQKKKHVTGHRKYPRSHIEFIEFKRAVNNPLLFCEFCYEADFTLQSL